MTLMDAETATFSELSHKPAEIAARAQAAGRVRITRRDGGAFYLTDADRTDRREETLSTATELLRAFMDDLPEALLEAVTKVFPWSRHLGREHAYEFTKELTAALSDAAELDNDAIAQEVIAGWKATARIMADPELYAEALRIGSGEGAKDFGPVEINP